METPKDNQVALILGFCNRKRLEFYAEQYAHHGDERRACQAMLDHFASMMEGAMDEMESADAYRRQIGLPERGYDGIHARHDRRNQ